MPPVVLDFLRAFAPLRTEAERARFLEAYFRRVGLKPHRDETGNLWVGGGPVVLAAHIDTVLEPAPLHEAEGAWWGPGVGDNSSGVAVLASLAGEVPEGVVLAFTVGEEGLGNLKGARALVRALEPEVFVAVDGYLGSLVERALGSVRLRARFLGPGGHAWGDRKAPNPVRALGEALAAAYALARGADEALNAGRVWGGEAINALPREAGCELDLRALEPEGLRALEAGVRRALMAAAQRVGVRLEVEVLGRRPVGRTAPEWLLALAEAACLEEGVKVLRQAGSTDASAAVEAGIPALGIGVYRGGGAHTPGEWVDPASLRVGRRVLLRFVRGLTAAGVGRGLR